MTSYLFCSSSSPFSPSSSSTSTSISYTSSTSSYYYFLVFFFPFYFSLLSYQLTPLRVITKIDTSEGEELTRNHGVGVGDREGEVEGSRNDI